MEYPLRRLVRGSQQAFVGSEAIVPSKRKLTPANILTWLRPTVLGLGTMYLIGKGKRGAVAGLLATIASDAEGNVARFISEHWPDSGLGVSEDGIREDPIADSVAIAEVGLGIFFSKKTSLLGKAAATIILAQEAKKAKWAKSVDKAYRAATATEANPKGDKLVIPADVEGKLAMVEKAIAGTAIVATAEVSNPFVRTGLGILAVGFAAAGSWRANRLQPYYQEQFEQRLEAVRLAQPVAITT